jgi:hypothetical protein
MATPSRQLKISLAGLPLAALAGWLLAGPLDPPAGPVASSHKTLSEVEPRVAINATNTPGDAHSLYKITQPGSYYLTGNITGVSGKHGIEIVASGVTLDLNGFDLVGVAGMGAFDGVSATTANLSNITVRNGSVRSWGQDGVDLGSSTVRNSTVVEVRIGDNAGNGISVGNSSIVSACTSFNNAGSGIVAIVGCTISACTANNNSGEGILTGNGSTISDCIAYSNDANGISTNNGCSVSGCTVGANTLHGIRVSWQCLVTGNTCSVNGQGGTGAGVYVLGRNSRIEGNTCTGGVSGIGVDSTGNIIRNTCAGNATNWAIVAGNSYGPIVSASSGPAVNGNSAASALGSTDPNANFTY